MKSNRPLSVRGKVMEGEFVRYKGNRAVVRVLRRRYYQKYKQFSYSFTKFTVTFDPSLGDLTEGQRVNIGETRPVAKGISFRIFSRA